VPCAHAFGIPFLVKIVVVRITKWDATPVHTASKRICRPACLNIQYGLRWPAYRLRDTGRHWAGLPRPTA